MSYLLIEQSLKVSLYMQHATLKKEDHKFNCTTQLIPNFFFFVFFSSKWNCVKAERDFWRRHFLQADSKLKDVIRYNLCKLIDFWMDE